jgi:uncharacterized coiled-coil DUF342 family protein
MVELMSIEDHKKIEELQKQINDCQKKIDENEKKISEIYKKIAENQKQMNKYNEEILNSKLKKNKSWEYLLKELYNKTRYPDHFTRMQLIEKTGIELNEGQIEIWFQNQRLLSDKLTVFYII